MKIKSNFLKIGKIILVTIPLSIFTAFICSFFYFTSIFEDFELDGLDFMFNLRGTLSEPPEEIVVIAIDEKSLGELGRWGEWSRSYYAQIIDYLSKGKPKVIGFDILFSEESKIFPKGDQELALATRRAGNVCHSMFSKNKWFWDKAPEITRPDLIKFSWGDVDSYTGMGDVVLLPIESILKEVHSVGYINLHQDKDGVVRSLHPLLSGGPGELYPSFSLQIACNYLEIKKEKLKMVLDRAKGGGINKGIIDLDRIKIPIDGYERMFISYRLSSIRHIPFSMVLNKQIPAEYFKDRIVLIGGTAAGFFDFVATPINPSMPGVDVHANIIYSIIKNDFISTVSSSMGDFIPFFLGLFSGFIFIFLRPLKSIIFATFLLIGYLILAFYLFEFRGIYLEIVRPVMVLVSIQIFFLSVKALVLSIKK